MSNDYWSNYSFNPFIEIMETKKHPTARMRRTYFWQKCKDSLYVITGRFWSQQEKDRGLKDHAGLFDYALLFIPLLLRACFELNKAKLKPTTGASKFLYRLFKMALLSIILPVNIVRIIVSSLCTLAAVPIIALVHASFFLYTRNDWKVALSTPIAEGRSLKQYLEENSNVDIEQFSIKVISVISDNVKGQDSTVKAISYKLKFQRRLGNGELGEIVIDKETAGVVAEKETADVFVDKDNAKKIMQLCAFNIGGIAKNLEKAGSLNTFESSLNDMSQDNIRLGG